MSRGFVKEEDQEEPIMVPPRAALPNGVTNYVTPNGMALLKTEMKVLEEERATVTGENETEIRRAKNLIDGKMNLLKDRIQSARILRPEEQPNDVVRFGAKVEINNEKTDQLQKFQIVGVDEADIKEQKISFIAPIARAVTGKKVGEKFDFKMGNEVKTFTLKKIEYN